MERAAPAELALASLFPSPTREQWLDAVGQVLRGRPFDEVLVTRLYDGVEVQPLYTAADVPAGARRPGLPGAAPFVRGSVPVRPSWDVRARHLVVDPDEANHQILVDLERGVTSVWLQVAPDALERALAGVYLDLAPVVLDAGADAGVAAEALIGLLRARDLAPSSVCATLGADPLGTGGSLEEAAALARRMAGELPGVRTMVVDAGIYHDAGGSDAEELGCSMATAVAYLRAMAAAGLDATQAAGQLEFRYVASADQFSTIAKLRAARRMWARVTEACGAPSAQLQHAVTSTAMMTRRDPWVNILRTTIAAFAAAVGGADAVTVLPFDAAIGQPDELARRLARNTQALLVDEAHLGRVTDPAGGSWYVESLTDALAHRGWEWFQEIERAGGMATALADGLVASRLEATWEARSRRLARRADPITGVSEYPDLAERPLERPPTPEGPRRVVPLRRYAAGFEALRDRADAASERPRVFLANLGALAVHNARATFATNFFAAGGIEAIWGEGVDSPVAAAGAYARSGARAACICSSDELYRERGQATARALHDAGARLVLVAGRQEVPGADGRIFAGCDAPDVLARTLDTLGVP